MTRSAEEKVETRGNCARVQAVHGAERTEQAVAHAVRDGHDEHREAGHQVLEELLLRPVRPHDAHEGQEAQQRRQRQLVARELPFGVAVGREPIANHLLIGQAHLVNLLSIERLFRK